MRSSPAAAILIALLGTTAAVQDARVDPQRLLADHFQFSARDLDRVRQGEPVVKVKVEGSELALVGAIHLPGKKERLADWVKNIEHFRRSAELGVAGVVPTPPSAASFAAVALDASDIAELQQCQTGKCAIRLPADTLGRLQREVRWGTANADSQANEIFRQMLLGSLTAYLAGGRHSPLAGRATTLTAIAPELANYLARYPQATLANADHLFYWSAMPAGSATIVSLHHLTVYRARPTEIWIADENVYASRYFDDAVLVIGLYDAPDGTGFYAVAGSRMQSSQLGGVGGTVLRRQIQRSAADSVKIYLEWMRDSLAAG